MAPPYPSSRLAGVISPDAISGIVATMRHKRSIRLVKHDRFHCARGLEAKLQPEARQRVDREDGTLIRNKPVGWLAGRRQCQLPVRVQRYEMMSRAMLGGSDARLAKRSGGEIATGPEKNDFRDHRLQRDRQPVNDALSVIAKGHGQEIRRQVRRILGNFEDVVMSVRQISREPAPAPRQRLILELYYEAPVCGVLILSGIVRKRVAGLRIRLVRGRSRRLVQFLLRQEPPLPFAKTSEPIDRGELAQPVERAVGQELGHWARRAVGQHHHPDPLFREYADQGSPTDPTAAMGMPKAAPIVTAAEAEPVMQVSDFLELGSALQDPRRAHRPNARSREQLLFPDLAAVELKAPGISPFQRSRC